MDLDAGINAVLERVKKTGSLDVQDEYFIKYFDIYSDIYSLKEKILKSGYRPITNAYFENKESIVDIRELLNIPNLYDFMEEIDDRYNQTIDADQISALCRLAKK